jgi:hypothetical protein
MQSKQKWMPRRPIRLGRSAEKLKSRGRVRSLVGVESAAAEDPTRYDPEEAQWSTQSTR